LFGLAGLMKPQLSGPGAVVAVAVAWRRRSVTPIVAILAGGLVPTLVCLGWFWARGALPDLVETLFVYVPRHVALSGGVDAGWLAWQTLRHTARKGGGLVFSGLLLLSAPGLGPRRAGPVGTLVAIALIQIAGVAVQGKFFSYHYGASVPVMSLLAAPGLRRAWKAGCERGRSAAALFLVAGALVTYFQPAHRSGPSFWRESFARTRAFLAPQVDRATLDQLETVADVDAKANRDVSAFLVRSTPIDRPVFVWGFEPVIYDLAERPCPTRYIYNVPQRAAWSRLTARQRLLGDLATRPPSAIVVEHGDVLPLVTGDELDSVATLSGFAELQTLLGERYQFAWSNEKFEVYLEKPWIPVSKAIR
jgi:hypothetical protein